MPLVAVVVLPVALLPIAVDVPPIAVLPLAVVPPITVFECVKVSKKYLYHKKQYMYSNIYTYVGTQLIQTDDDDKDNTL